MVIDVKHASANQSDPRHFEVQLLVTSSVLISEHYFGSIGLSAQIFTEFGLMQAADLEVNSGCNGYAS